MTSGRLLLSRVCTCMHMYLLYVEVCNFIHWQSYCGARGTCFTMWVVFGLSWWGSRASYVSLEGGLAPLPPFFFLITFKYY